MGNKRATESQSSPSGAGAAGAFSPGRRPDRGSEEADQSDDSIELVGMEPEAEDELEAARAVWATYLRQVLYVRLLCQSPVQWASEPP